MAAVAGCEQQLAQCPSARWHRPAASTGELLPYSMAGRRRIKHMLYCILDEGTCFPRGATNAAAARYQALINDSRPEGTTAGALPLTLLG